MRNPISNKAILTPLFGISVYRCFLSMYQLSSYRTWIDGFMLISWIIFVLIHQKKGESKKHKYLIYAMCILSLCGGFILHRYLISGLQLLANQITQTYGEKAGTKFYQIETNLQSNHRVYALVIILLILSVFILHAAFSIIYNGNKLIMSLILGILLVPGFVGVKPAVIDEILVLVAVGFILIRGFFNVFYLSIILISIMCCYYIGVFHETSNIFAIHENLVNELLYLCYQSHKEGMLPEGDLRVLQPLKLSAKTALNLVMSEPNSYYLRGFVGSEYKNSQWKALNYYESYHAYDLFYWLHEESFSPLTQLGTVSSMAQETNIVENQTVYVKVHVLYASKQFRYLPYEYLILENELTDTIQSVDSNYQNRGIFGKNIYDFNAISASVPTYPKILEGYRNSSMNNHEIKQYKKNEANYQMFAKEQYLKLPTYIIDILDRQLGYKQNEKENITYKQVTKIIKDYLELNITYDTNVQGELDGHDIVEYILDYSRRGYNIHYATIATLMYRYFNIPARYVEGYLITPKDIQYSSNYDSVSIKGYNAHAWVEIYLNEIGWIPIELTPAYQEVMEQPKELTSQGVRVNSTSSLPKEKEEFVPPEEEKDMKKVTLDDRTEYITLFHILLFGIGLLFILLCISYLINYCKIKKSIHQDNRNEAVISIFHLLIKKFNRRGMSYSGGSIYQYTFFVQNLYGSTFAEQYRILANIVLKAKFSNHKINESEYQEALKFFNQIKVRRFKRISSK